MFSDGLSRTQRGDVLELQMPFTSPAAGWGLSRCPAQEFPSNFDAPRLHHVATSPIEIARGEICLIHLPHGEV